MKTTAGRGTINFQFRCIKQERERETERDDAEEKGRGETFRKRDNVKKRKKRERAKKGKKEKSEVKERRERKEKKDYSNIQRMETKKVRTVVLNQ